MEKLVTGIARWYWLIWRGYPRNIGFWLLSAGIFFLSTRSWEVRFLVWFLFFGVGLPPFVFVMRYLQNKLMEEQKGKRREDKNGKGGQK